MSVCSAVCSTNLLIEEVERLGEGDSFDLFRKYALEQFGGCDIYEGKAKRDFPGRNDLKKDEIFVVDRTSCSEEGKKRLLIGFCPYSAQDERLKDE